MKKIRFIIAMLVGKLALLVLKLLRRTASYTPGYVALKIYPDFLGDLKMPQTVICVTGTNGKTTTSNLLADTLRECGYTVTNNSAGSNVQAGVATALLEDSTLGGKPTKQIAVLEVDERSSIKVYSYISPDYLICNNIMRDSLKRNAHTDFIVYIINKALSDKTHVLLNADDLICCSVAPKNAKRTYFGVAADEPSEWNPDAPRDIYYCPVCGTKLDAEYIRYNHIGRFSCPKCDYSSPKRDYTVTDINYEDNLFTIEHNGQAHEYRLVNDNIVNVYNCCGAVALLSEFGLSYEQISSSLMKQKIVKSRFDSFKAGKLNITMQLAKGQNPIACARAYSYVTGCPAEKKSLLIMVDDKSDNTGNSESVCWIYDCDYSALTNDSVGEIIFSGPRCKDQKLRALLAGVDESKIKTIDTFTGGVELVDTEKYNDIFILYDPYLLAEADKVKNELIRKGGND
ncbi:MAG: MurT ligase domain-containing protein [Eubacteriales bacterium]